MTSDPPACLDFDRDGAVHHAGAARSILPTIDHALAALPDRPGVRITANPLLASLLTTDGSIGAIAAARIGPNCRPVRALLFDKTAATNWALGWHQDRTIVVRARRAAPGFGPWTVKQGLHHVAPPFALLAGMVTLRVHLDAVPVTNAPLRIAPGSHRAGLVAVDTIAEVVRHHGSHDCLAAAGDIWLYATPILHASDRATHPARRRVLQIDYAGFDLPHGLEWLGIDGPA